MYTGLGQQQSNVPLPGLPLTGTRVNPDGSITYFYAPPSPTAYAFQAPTTVQAPLLKRINPDGSVTWYFGPPETVVQHFPEAAAAVPVSIAEQQAAIAAAQAATPGAPLTAPRPATPPWLVPALIGGALLLVL